MKKAEKYFTEQMAMGIYPFQPKISKNGKARGENHLSKGSKKATIRKSYLGK